MSIGCVRRATIPLVTLAWLDVGTAGTVSSGTYNYSHGVRPALWVDYVS